MMAALTTAHSCKQDAKLGSVNDGAVNVQVGVYKVENRRHSAGSRKVPEHTQRTFS